MKADDLAQLAAAVQRNADIADARHAGEMTLCTYLLQMREFYRWQQGLAQHAPLDRQAVGRWMADHEAHWAELEDQPYADLSLRGPGAPQAWPAFDAAGLNQRLLPHGLMYGAGLAGPQRPVFFLARVHTQVRRGGLDVLVAGQELARGLLAPAAALAGEGQGPILVRRESLARWAWERTELQGSGGRMRSAPRAMLAAYGLDSDFAAALPRWLDDQVETAILHELGEHQAEALLGPAWRDMRLALHDTLAAGRAVALRDQLADMHSTLPALLQRGEAAPIHAWFAAYEGLRQSLFPGLEQAYLAWAQGRDAALAQAVQVGAANFEVVAQQVLRAWADGPDAAAAALRADTAICPWQPAPPGC